MTARRGCIVLVLLMAAGLGWAFAWFSGLLATHIDDLQFVALEPVHPAKGRENMRLRFRSEFNLRQVASKSGAFGLYAVVSLCPYRSNPLVSIGRVLHNDIDLDTRPVKACISTKQVPEVCKIENDTPQVRAEVEGVNQPGPYFYDVYFVYDGTQLLSEDHAFRSVPMPEGVEDLCMRIDEHGPPGLTSNVVRIPKAALSRALFTPR